MVGSAATGERTQFLPAVPASAGAARRLITGVLAAWGQDDLADPAELLVTEVVTNAILHAGTDVEVRARQLQSGVRVEVHDGSPVLPGARWYGDEATTGRGLGLVDALSSSWGVDATETGKVVWFDVGGSSGAGPGPGPTADPRSAPPGAGPAIGHVRLLGLPVALAHATLQYGDAVMRELLLLSLAGELGEDEAPLHTTPDLDVSDILAALEAARAEGRSTVDLDLERPCTDAELALERLAFVDEADRLAREDRLLTPAAVPEVTSCRHWLMGEIAVQLRGGPATPWELGTGLAATEVAEQPLADADREALLAVEGPVLAADSSNRLTFVNAAAASLLGWEPSELVGRRLTAVIPPRLREAHLAGFTRLHVTGEERLVGRTVRVPALCADGSELEVELRIEAVGGPGGRSTFRGFLAPVADDGAHPGA